MLTGGGCLGALLGRCCSGGKRRTFCAGGMWLGFGSHDDGLRPRRPLFKAGWEIERNLEGTRRRPCRFLPAPREVTRNGSLTQHKFKKLGGLHVAVEVHTDRRNTKMRTWLTWSKYYRQRGFRKIAGKYLERADVRECRWVGAPGDRVKVSQLGREKVVMVVVVGWSRK